MPDPSVSPSTSDVVNRLFALAQTGPVALLCDPSPEGVLSAVGAAYLAKAPALGVRLVRSDDSQLRLGEQPLVMEPDPVLAKRVNAGLNQKITQRGRVKLRNQVLGGRPTVEWARANSVLYACCCDDADMPQAVNEFAREVFSCKGDVRSLESTPAVTRFRELLSFAWGELEHVRQFVRFSRMSDGAYFAVFKPAANVVPLSLSSFASRMGSERFCVLDPVHLIAVLYDGTTECPVDEEVVLWDGAGTGERPLSGRRAIVRFEPQDAELLAQRSDFAEDEQYVRALWKHFYDAMALPGRGKKDRGYDLRASWEPKRFWAGLTEMDPGNDDPGEFIPERYRG